MLKHEIQDYVMEVATHYSQEAKERTIALEDTHERIRQVLYQNSKLEEELEMTKLACSKLQEKNKELKAKIKLINQSTKEN